MSAPPGPTPWKSIFSTAPNQRDQHRRPAIGHLIRAHISHERGGIERDLLPLARQCHDLAPGHRREFVGDVARGRAIQVRQNHDCEFVVRFKNNYAFGLGVETSGVIVFSSDAGLSTLPPNRPCSHFRKIAGRGVESACALRNRHVDEPGVLHSPAAR